MTNLQIEVLRDPIPKVTRCKAEECGALVEWVVTRHGRKMPVTAPLTPIEVINRLDGREWVVIEASSSHFATCPASVDFRRRRAGAEP